MKKLIFILIALLALNSLRAQWIKMPNGITTNKIVWSLASKGDTVFAGTDNGVYRSTNNGLNWTLKFSYNTGNVILIYENMVYVGTDQGVYSSSDWGQNWIQPWASNKWVWALAKYGDTIFAGCSGGSGLYRSTNNGATWIQTQLTNQFISSIAIKGNKVFAGDWAESTVYLSTDNGANWVPTYLGGEWWEVVLCLAVKDNYLFAGLDNAGVYFTTNNGIEWTQTSLIYSILCLTVNGNNIFAGTMGYSVYLSTNDGKNWIKKNQGMPGIQRVWSLSTNSQYIFAGTDSCVWRRPLSDIISIQPVSSEIPASFSLSQNYPNPFNPSTKISFKIPSPEGWLKAGVGLVTLKVYDITGKEVAVLVNEALQPGTYEVTFDGSGLTSGVYFYKLQAGEFAETKRMVLVK